MPGHSLRYRIYRLLDPQDQLTRGSSAVNWLIIAAVFVSVIAMALETEAVVKEQFAATFQLLETAALIFFSIEYLARPV